MRVTIATVAAIAALGALGGCGGKATSSAQAASATEGEAIGAVGCPAQPKPECVTIAAGGKTYDITEAKIDMSKGVGVSLTGTAKGEVGACGPKLTDVKVDYLSLQCAAPAAPAG
jgi:hypothetical protein